MTLTDATMIVHYDPVPVALLNKDMAVLVDGEWFRIVDAWTGDTGHRHVSFPPGSGAEGASFPPEECAWAYPDWQRIADLAYSLPETAGFAPAVPVREQLAVAERAAAAAALERDHWGRIAIRRRWHPGDRTAAYSAGSAAARAAQHERDRGRYAARAAQLRAELAGPDGGGER